jgi:hypothetical protein
MSKKEAERRLEEQAASFFERARNLDFNRTDAITAAAVAGVGLATVAGILAARKLKNRVTTADGEEVSVAHQPAQYMTGMASYVRLPGGEAASFPADDETAARLRAGQVPEAGVFIMEEQGDVVRGAQGDPRYKRVAQWAIGFAQHALSSLGHGEQEQAVPPEVLPPGLPEA